jgi:hypothetical protein
MPELLIIVVPVAAMALGKPAHWMATVVRSWARHRYGL